MALAERRRVTRPASVDERLTRLEQLLGPDGRYALLRARAGDYEIRLLSGDVGRGATATDAIDALIAELTA